MPTRLVADKYGRYKPSPTEQRVLNVMERHGQGVENRWMSEQEIWRRCREHGMTHAKSTIRAHVNGLALKNWLDFEYKDKKRKHKPQWKLKDARYRNTCAECTQEFKSMELDYLCERCRY